MASAKTTQFTNPPMTASATTQPDVSMAELDSQLNTSPDGLSQEEAARRLRAIGPNELIEKKRNPLLRALAYFWGPIPWMIEAAAVLSALVRHWPDFTIILVLLIANGAIGFWEEFQAGSAIAALKEKLALKARVRRDGAWKTIAARELVPGDALRLRLGDVVPADVRLRDQGSLEVDQSVLTGESLPVSRSTGDVVFSGSAIKR
jgi:H+-transporting ATPase